MKCSSRPLAGLVDFALDQGLLDESLEPLLVGVPVSREDLRRGTRISWDAHAIVLDRLAEVLGDDDQLDTCARFAFPRFTGLVNSLAGNIFCVRLLYLGGARVTGPRLWPMTRGFHEDLAHGVLRQRIEIDDAHCDSEPFFHVMRGAIAAAPSVLGLPGARVEMEIRPRRATYEISLGLPYRDDIPPRVDRDGLQSAGKRVFEFVSDPLTSRLPELRHGDSRLFQESEEPGNPSLVERVRSEIAIGFRRAEPAAAQIANSLGVSVRTLARQLSAAGTTFQTIRDDVRRELAINLIHEDLTIDEIAFELRFSDSTSFYRAFRRWTGLSPSEFRRVTPLQRTAKAGHERHTDSPT